VVRTVRSPHPSRAMAHWAGDRLGLVLQQDFVMFMAEGGLLLGSRLGGVSLTACDAAASVSGGPVLRGVRSAAIPR
jgi:hypothetical protein